MSVVVGLLFWPRGAAAELARALVQGYGAATAWLVAAIDHVGREDPARPTGRPTGPGHGRRPAAGRRLPAVPVRAGRQTGALPTVTRLLTGCAAIRLTARTLERLPVLAAPGTRRRSPRWWRPGRGHRVVPVDGAVVLRVAGTSATRRWSPPRAADPRCTASCSTPGRPCGDRATRRGVRRPAPAVGRGATGRPPPTAGRAGRHRAGTRLTSAGCRRRHDRGPVTARGAWPPEVPWRRVRVPLVARRRRARGQVGDHLEPDPPVERRVPRHVAERRQRDPDSPAAGPTGWPRRAGRGRCHDRPFGHHRQLVDMGLAVDQPTLTKPTAGSPAAKTTAARPVDRGRPGKRADPDLGQSGRTPFDPPEPVELVGPPVARPRVVAVPSVTGCDARRRHRVAVGHRDGAGTGRRTPRTPTRG